MKYAVSFLFLVACGAQNTGVSSEDLTEDTAAPLSWEEAHCQDMRNLKLSNVSVKDQNGDGVFQPGERISIELDVTHAGTKHFISYPQIHFLGEGFEVVSQTHYYGIFAGDTERFHASGVVSHELAIGNLRAIAGADGSHCSGVDQIQVPVQMAATCSVAGELEYDHACGELAGLSLSDARVEGDLRPGGKATVTVFLNEISGKTMGWYPGIAFSAVDTEATVADDHASLYALPACQSRELSTEVTFNASLPAGSKVRIFAKPTAINNNCNWIQGLEIPVQLR